jgi:hypothetical protein
MAIETLGAALRRISRLLEDGTVTGFSDARLLERFVSGHDAVAFEALLARHGPMVLSVRRGGCLPGLPGRHRPPWLRSARSRLCRRPRAQILLFDEKAETAVGSRCTWSPARPSLAAWSMRTEHRGLTWSWSCNTVTRRIRSALIVRLFSQPHRDRPRGPVPRRSLVAWLRVPPVSRQGRSAIRRQHAPLGPDQELG